MFFPIILPHAINFSNNIRGVLMIESFDVVFLTSIFVLPGFLMSRIIDISNPAHKEGYGIYILRCLLLSLVNCACSSWVFGIVFKLKEIRVLYWLSLLGAELFVSSSIALVISVLKQKQIIQKFFRRIGLNPCFSTPTAWDYALSKPESRFVAVTLMDGNQIYGFYSGNSYSSSAFDGRDLFLEKTYTLKDDKWCLLPHSEGILISNNQICTIEFMEVL